MAVGDLVALGLLDEAEELLKREAQARSKSVCLACENGYHDYDHQLFVRGGMKCDCPCGG